MGADRLTKRELAAWVRLVSLTELLPSRLDSRLRADAGLTHYEYFVLAVLSESPGRTQRMGSLASQTNATLPRLSNVVRRLEQRGLVARARNESDARASDVRLTDEGWSVLSAAAPDHVRHVRSIFVDALTAEQIEQLTQIADAILRRLEPGGVVSAMYRRHDPSAATSDTPARAVDPRERSAALEPTGEG